MNKYFALFVVLAALVAVSVAVPYPAPYPVAAPAAAPAAAAPAPAGKESLKGQEAVYVGYAGYPYLYGAPVAYLG
ncbi:methylmalonyl-CoA decarboxylase subunit gamma-like [Schistocerca americana]|uniref:methylmalonyl-CoA decarboxylase subunit gamma-like n=1 Tax=Schistocerca americana TaxID=7009 RepID=UPI001F501F08|nr:methylmalonyl-CoA decarboxylase subunit gamma-like [Schistocerca americana]XP_049780060.1 methylmalonyl-CoA decarboxylase subunit gamma-like [Schistocerca cancellata]